MKCNSAQLICLAWLDNLLSLPILHVVQQMEGVSCPSQGASAEKFLHAGRATIFWNITSCIQLLLLKCASIIYSQFDLLMRVPYHWKVFAISLVTILLLLVIQFCVVLCALITTGNTISPSTNLSRRNWVLIFSFFHNIECNCFSSFQFMFKCRNKGLLY